MSAQPVERRLAAILAADVAGYSRLMGEDEAGTLARLRTHRRELIDPKVAAHKGRIVKTTGDGILIEFPSVVEAVACAVAVQQGMAERNAATPEQQRIVFRVGINLGDVIIEDGDIHGDGVNVAARLEGIAEPGEICVSAVVRDQVQSRLDCVFEDLGEQTLKNISRPVKVYRVARTRRVADALAIRPLLTLPDKPSIAVLPFQNMSGDPEQEYFADGMVEEIITALSRIRWLFVIARNSSFTYKGQAIDVKRVGRELGVRYVLEGSVRKGGGQVRITAQLIEAETGAHLWADRFDGSLEDVFDLQDKVAVSVAGVIEPALQAAETVRSTERPTADLTAYDLYLRAGQVAAGTFSPERIQDAANLLAQAIARDPNYGPALAMAARIRVDMDVAGASGDPEHSRHEAITLARRAAEAAPDDPIVLAAASFALGYFGEEIDAAITLVDRALRLNPSYARGWHTSGWLRLYSGDLERAIEHQETSMRLNPRANTAVPLAAIGAAYFFAGDIDLAIPKLLAATQQMPSHATSHRFLAACYAHLGRVSEASAIVAKLRALNAVDEPRITRWRKPEHQELLLSGLRLALGDTT